MACFYSALLAWFCCAVDTEGIIAPRRVSNAGKVIGDVPFSRGTLYLMLRRVTYTGRIPHGDKIYPGNHPAIIDVETFDRVAALLAAHRQGDGERTRVSRPSLLAGRIVDAEGASLIATHATKPGATSAATTRYRYYVSRALHHKESDTGMRLPAREIETLVADRVAALFDDPIALVGTAWLDVPIERYGDLHHRCAELAARLRQRDPSAMAIVEKVQVHSARIDVVCRIEQIATALGVTLHEDAPATLTLTDAVRLTRSGRAMRLVHGGSHTTPAATDAALIRLIVQARRWWGELKQGEIDIAALAAREGKTSSYVTRVVRLAFLAPIVLEAILNGRQRVGVDARRLTLAGPLPARWVAQEAALLPA